MTLGDDKKCYDANCASNAFFSSKKKTCINCVPLCLKCSDEGTCLTCEAPFAPKKGECTVCDPGTYYKEGTCKKCDDSCETCFEAGKCLTCKKNEGMSAVDPILCTPCKEKQFLAGNTR